jgi:hypothetical protein
MAEILFITASILIVIMHFASVIAKKKIAEIFIYVNLALHTVLVFSLMWLKVAIEFFALCFMTSLLIYLFLSLIFYKLSKRRRGKDDV